MHYHHGIISARLSSNSEAKASELLENLEEITDSEYFDREQIVEWALSDQLSVLQTFKKTTMQSEIICIMHIGKRGNKLNHLS